MTNPDSIAEMIKMTFDTFGRLDVLVNNAGIQHVAPLQEFPTAKWDAILAINLSSAFHTTRLALPSMVANKWGRIVNIASAHGLVGSALQVGLCRGQARHGRPDQSDGARDGGAGHHLQRDLPRLRLTPLVEAQIAEQTKANDMPRERSCAT